MCRILRFVVLWRFAAYADEGVGWALSLFIHDHNQIPHEYMYHNHRPYVCADDNRTAARHVTWRTGDGARERRVTKGGAARSLGWCGFKLLLYQPNPNHTTPNQPTELPEEFGGKNKNTRNNKRAGWTTTTKNETTNQPP